MFALPTGSFAQSQRNPCFYSGAGPSSSSGCIPVSTPSPLPVSASLGGGFTDATTGTPISVTASAGGVSGTLPAGTVVAAFNVGTANGAYCKLGASSTTSDVYLAPNGGWFAFSVGANTQLTCITSTSTTTVNMVGGSGLPTGSGGGSSGGGGGGAITAAINSYAAGALSAGAFAAGAGVDGWDLTQGAKADAVCGTSTGTCSVLALLKYANTQQAALVAGLLTPPISVTQSTQGTNAAAWWVQIGDTTNGPAAVKAASTAAVATDKALVVGISPNGINANGSNTSANSTPVVIASDQASVPIKGAGPAAVSGAVPFTLSSQYPTNATTTTPTAVTATTTGTTAATAASLGATVSVTNYVCGFDITADATALAVGTATLSGTISGSLNYLQTVTAAANGSSALTRSFNPCIPASAANTAITITSVAAGTGGNTIVNIWGYRL